MISDHLTTFAWEADVSGSTGTGAFGDVIDIGSLGEQFPDIGNGQPVYLVILAVGEIEAGAGGTVQFQLVSADEADLTGNPIVHLESGEFDAEAGVTAGTPIFIGGLPLDDYRRYVGLRLVRAGAATSDGEVSAFLVLDATRWKAYPEGNN